MREIKFRAWNDRANLMLEVSGINWETKSILHKHYPDSTYSVSGECGASSFFEIELMQYTGLKDKNGKEIYEGDIVRYWHVPYNTGGMGAGWKTEVIVFGKALPPDPEIIGNIHENPELLKER